MFIETLSSNPRYFLSVVITVVLSVCLHELAHGIVAIWYGDRTPIETGHMTLNPIVHMGPMSLLLLALAGIAWGQMPVNPRRMHGRHAAAVVALAGPASNLLLALLALLSLGLWQRFSNGPTSNLDDNIRLFLLVFGGVNVTLAIFNCIPIPPLDGSRFLAHYSPGYVRLMVNMRQQIGIAFLLLFIFAGKYISLAGFSAAVWFLHTVRGW
jgi:Zn-dependent protease